MGLTRSWIQRSLVTASNHSEKANTSDMLAHKADFTTLRSLASKFWPGSNRS